MISAHTLFTCTSKKTNHHKTNLNKPKQQTSKKKVFFLQNTLENNRKHIAAPVKAVFDTHTKERKTNKHHKIKMVNIRMVKQMSSKNMNK